MKKYIKSSNIDAIDNIESAEPIMRKGIAGNLRRYAQKQSNT